MNEETKRLVDALRPLVPEGPKPKQSCKKCGAVNEVAWDSDDEPTHICVKWPDEFLCMKCYKTVPECDG